MKKSFALIAACTAILASFALSAFWPQEYSRVPSPDGRHFAVAKYRAYEGWLPRMPGGSGDKSGWLVIETKDGKQVGTVDLGMVSEIAGLQWAKDTLWVPGHGEIKL
jgi:hypothetical protein